MRKLRLINIEWNDWNGFVFSLLTIDWGEFEGSLLGLWLAKDQCNISLLFFDIDIRGPLS